jgi:hypothetical protein
MPLSPKLRGHLAPAAQIQNKVNPLGERGALDRHEAHFHSNSFSKSGRGIGTVVSRSDMDGRLSSER